MILKIIHNGVVIPKANNNRIYDEWETMEQHFVYYTFSNPKNIRKMKPGDMGKHIAIHSIYGSKNKCLIITDDNEDEYPEYMI